MVRSRSWRQAIARFATVLSASLLIAAPASLSTGASARMIVVGFPSAEAADVDGLHRDLANDPDFRVRVAAALALGKIKNPNSVDPLIKALQDKQPAVRTAVAAALGALTDPSCLPALTRAKDAEKNTSTKTAMEKAIAKLSETKTRFLIAIGKLEAKNGVGSKAAVTAFRSTARDRIARLPGCELLSDRDLPGEAKKRNLPAIVLDGHLTKLSKSNGGGDIGFAAHVEFLMRKVPEQSLKGSVRGDAKALASAASVRGDKDLSQLEVDAVQAAVQSALKGAPNAIAQAVEN